MDWCALLAHDLWLQPAQIIIGLGILIHLIGYSALGESYPIQRQPLKRRLLMKCLSSVGLGVLLIGIPAQSVLFKRLIAVRHERQLAFYIFTQPRSS